MKDRDKIRNVGWLEERNQINPWEKIFAESWEKENSKEFRILPLLQQLFVFDNAVLFTVITGRDRMIAGTLMQWLGTNEEYLEVLQDVKDIVEVRISGIEEETEDAG